MAVELFKIAAVYTAPEWGDLCGHAQGTCDGMAA
jgi:hypothetical protein